MKSSMSYLTLAPCSKKTILRMSLMDFRHKPIESIGFNDYEAHVVVAKVAGNVSNSLCIMKERALSRDSHFRT